MSKFKPPLVPRFDASTRAPMPSYELMGIGARVLDSPSGPGVVESFGRDGLPRINGDVATWCLFAYGPSLRVFDPYKHAPEEYRKDLT